MNNSNLSGFGGFGGFCGVGIGSAFNGQFNTQTLDNNQEVYFKVLDCEEAEGLVFKITSIAFNFTNSGSKLQIDGETVGEKSPQYWVFDEGDNIVPVPKPTIPELPVNKFKVGDICYVRHNDWLPAVVKCEVLGINANHGKNYSSYQLKPYQNKEVNYFTRWEFEMFASSDEAFNATR